MGWISIIFSALFKAGIEYIGNWYQRKQAEVDRFNLMTTQAKLDSVVVGHDIEVKIDQAVAAVKPVTTLTEFKLQFGIKDFAGQVVRIAACLLLLVSLAGCRYQVVANEYKPEIKKPEPPPEMFQGPEQLTAREQAMALHIGRLNAAIDVVNKDAHDSNIKNGYIKGTDKAKALKH